AEVLVLAIGYNVDPEWGEIVPVLKRDRWDRLVVDPETMQTNLPGVFAGGDDVNGADLVVTALADAHRAADAIEAYLRTVIRQPDGEPRKLIGDSSLLG
ncbi:MAG: FAD-dependent oxidoreductase, partial [Dehalococcoidia bacterium]|nr:FAD-dependent oxidoreductase [Dehalococcoidia bacterium]